VIEGFVRGVYRARWPLLALWVAVLAIAGVVGAPLKGQLSGGGWEVRGSQARHVLEVERAGFVGRGSTTLTAVVHDTRYTKADPQFTDRAQRVFEDGVRNCRVVEQQFALRVAACGQAQLAIWPLEKNVAALGACKLERYIEQCEQDFVQDPGGVQLARRFQEDGQLLKVGNFAGNLNPGNLA